LDQENLPEQSKPQAGPRFEPREGLRFSGKALLVVSAVVIALLLVAAQFPAVRSTWAGLVNKPQSLGASQSAKTYGATAAPRTSESASAAAPSQAADASAEEQAQKIWAEFEKTFWNATLEAWLRQHTEISCQPFHGNMWGGGADRQWSHRCSAGAQPEDAHWSFYAFGLEEPIVPRLEQFEVTTPSLSAESLTAVHNQLQSRLAARFGPGEDTSPKFGHPRDPIWPPNFRWQTAELEIQLFQSELDPQHNTGRMRLQARGRALLDALKEDERLKQFAAGGYLYQAGSGIDAQLAENLKGEFPAPATMLMKQQPDADPQKVAQALQQWQQQFRASQAAGQSGVRAAVIGVPQEHWKVSEFKDAIVRLLTAAKSAPPGRQPVLLLAADRLAGRMIWVAQNDTSQKDHWAEWRRQLATLGLSYDGTGDSTGGDSWIYSGSLLKRASTEYGQSAWGEKAFVLLLSAGFDTGMECAAGSDQFRTVIPQGLQFLETHPNSPYRFDVQLAVAQAYETWWSLSQAPAGTESEDNYSTVEPEKYQEGAAAARQKAITGYEALVQTSPQSDQAAYARRQLPRLKLGADTGQRRYYCEVGD